MTLKKINAVEVEAQHGEKMIEVKVRFYTNDIATAKGKVRPKHAWTEGVVRMDKNDAHGIKPEKEMLHHFDSLLDVGAAIERVLIDHEIVLHPSRKMRKYLEL